MSAIRSDRGAYAVDNGAVETPEGVISVHQAALVRSEGAIGSDEPTSVTTEGAIGRNNPTSVTTESAEVRIFSLEEIVEWVRCPSEARPRGESMSPVTDTPKATKTEGTFQMDCSVSVRINASPERTWGLLTDAGGFPGWNSTVTRIDGTIAAGETLKIQVPSAPGRVFKPKVSNVEPARTMTWSDGFAPMFKGVRLFKLTPGADGATEFFMREAYSGLMLPMIKGSLPDFGPIFETYAANLKTAAERAARG